MEPFQATTGDETVPVQITVLSGSNLKGSKGKSFFSFLRAEFNGAILGESQKLEALPDQSVEYNFTCGFDCGDGANTRDDIAHRPVILTVMEILPKEKKQKEERTIVLGQAALDLLPLLHGQCISNCVTLLHLTPESPGETVSEGSNRPTLDVTICVSEPLLSDVQLGQSNLLKITVETAYSVPEAWATGTGPPFNYVAALQVPLSAEKEQTLLFSNGVLKAGGEREPLSRPKKWPLGPLLAPGAQFIPGTSIDMDPIEMEDGDLTGVKGREFHTEAETDRKRVSWDTERRCFLDPGAVASLTQHIEDCRLWPVEVMRSAQGGIPKGGKAGKDKAAEEEALISFHGVAYVDLAPLLYPGAKRIRGAYRLCPFYESDLQAKTKRNTSILRDSMRAPAAQPKGRVPSALGSSQWKAAPTKIPETQKGTKEPKDPPKKLVTQGKTLPAESVAEVETQGNVEGQMYTEAGTYIVIEISLEKSLVPKRPPEELARRVMELIPPRPPLPRLPVGAERAVQDYQAQVTSVVGQVLEQYRQLFGAAMMPGSPPLNPATQEERKSQLLAELNYSGRYFAFKEQMKHSVVRIVREKMLRTEVFSDQEQLQAFLSQLYVFLVDEMHVALNKTLSSDTQEMQQRPLLDSAQLRHFAREAELNKNYALADQYYQERLAQDRQDPVHWFDYGAFHMLTGDHVKAQECFHQAVSVKQSHLPSVLMCGVLAGIGGRYEEAETFLERGTCLDPTSVVAWTLFGLFYESQENAIQAEMAFLEANKQLRATLASSPPSGGEAGPERQRDEVLQQDKESVTSDVEEDTESLMNGSKVSQEGGLCVQDGEAPNPEPVVLKPPASSPRLKTTIYMETVQFLLQNNALQMAQRALAQQLLCPDGGPSSSYHLALARLQLLSGEFGCAEASLKEALNGSLQNPDVWALSGHLHYLMGNFSKAEMCYKRTLDFVTDASDTHPIYLRLGDIYLQEGQFEKAKPTYLRGCKSSPSCLTWLGVGIACYRLGELTEAEDALTEANTLNNAHPEVWGYLSLVCLRTGRQLEAEQCYKYAIKLDLQKETLWQEITELQAQERILLRTAEEEELGEVSDKQVGQTDRAMPAEKMEDSGKEQEVPNGGELVYEEKEAEESVRPEDLSELLAAGTKDSHDKAENTQFVKDFLRGRIRRELFKLGTVALYFTYTAMEEEIERNKEHPQYAPLYFPAELHRHEALARDVEYFYGEDWESQISCSPATQRYVDRIHEVGQSDPVLLVAHTYTRYMGDLSGGQVLKKVAQRAMKLPATGEGLNFYQFDGINSAKAFKQLYRSRMNELELDGPTKEKIVAEANMAFQFNVEVFSELEEIGKTVQDEVLDAGLPVHGDKQGDISKCPYYATKMAASGGAAYISQVAMAALRHPTGQVLLASWVAIMAGLAAWYLM
ncbi:hypothetical protein AAFF_G00419680 [Aldrovandia affinis]|uniref:heme oxygenase (biliverdin-producing) n=1 Tax=Aldrovandia affinis TaxID=143900 RepID=A0AAD7WIZ8_9TELE|nr:hypothetical protein AAFF_G00419680 [Aldrovandia affinis]